MTIQGIIFIDIMGVGFFLLVLNLIRKHLLSVGYAIIWMIAVICLMLMITITPIREIITTVVGANYPASALSLLAFIFIFTVLIYLSVQLSIISMRQVELAQAIALLGITSHESEDKAREMPTNIKSPVDENDDKNLNYQVYEKEY